MFTNFWYYFDQPQNSFGKWLALSPFKRYFPLLMFFSLLSYLPISIWWQQQQSVKEQQHKLTQLQQEFAHQQRLWASISPQQHPNEHKLASALTPINQQLQQLSQSLQLQIKQNRWLFTPSPTLQLQITGHFPTFAQFIQRLLQHSPQLHLLEIQIQQQTEKTEQSSIIAHIHLGLYI